MDKLDVPYITNNPACFQKTEEQHFIEKDAFMLQIPQKTQG
jgi:hypothetical protein